MIHVSHGSPRMPYALICLSAALGSAVTLYLGGWTHGLGPGAIVVAAIALLAVAAAGIVPRPVRAAWHRRRAKSCSRLAETSSGLWPLAWVGWVAVSIVEWAHILRSEALS